MTKSQTGCKRGHILIDKNHIRGRTIIMNDKNAKKKAGRPKKTGAVDMARWTVIVPWETRIAVTKAAEKSQVSLNEWIDRELLKAAREALTGKREVAKPDDVMDVIKEMATRLDKISSEFDKPWWKKII